MKTANQAYAEKLYAALESVKIIEQALLNSRDPFGKGSDMLNWGHVGDMEHIAELLKRVASDMGYHEHGIETTDAV